MFVLRAVRFKNVYEGGIVLIPTHKSNVRELIDIENDKIESNNCINGSVNVMKSNVQINLRLSKTFFELDRELLYDIHITPLRTDNKMMKIVYKLSKVVISNDVIEDVEEDEEDVILDRYEIKEMYDSAKKELEEKLYGMSDDIVKIQKRIRMMDINMENLNRIAEMNTNFDRNLLKNYI